VFDQKDGLAGSVFTVYEDADHNIWFGTDKGAQRYDGLRWTTDTSDDGLIDSEIWAIIQDREGQRHRCAPQTLNPLFWAWTARATSTIVRSSVLMQKSPTASRSRSSAFLAAASAIC
jgi:ligand-binding sensor domain-containing protein